jgi:hypothetical protein
MKFRSKPPAALLPHLRVRKRYLKKVSEIREFRNLLCRMGKEDDWTAHVDWDWIRIVLTKVADYLQDCSPRDFCPECLKVGRV